MAEIGQYLRQAREKLGYSLEDMNRVTNIHTEYLQALENDQFDILPSPFYARAFLRTYAKSLELEVKPLLELYEQVAQPKLPSPPIHSSGRLPGNIGQEGTPTRMRPTLLPPPDRLEGISSKGTNSQHSPLTTGSLLDSDRVHSSDPTDVAKSQTPAQKRVHALESTPSKSIKKSPVNSQPNDPSKKALSPRRVALEAKQGTTNKENKNKKVPKLAITIAIGALLLVGGGTAIYNSDFLQTNQVNKKDSSSNQNPDSIAPNLSLNAGEQQLPFLEEGETSSSELEGQLYYINNVDQLDVVLKGKNGESVVQYGPNSSSREQKTLRVGQSLKIDTAGKNQIWFRITIPSNVEVIVNGQLINTMAQDTDKSYRIQVKNKK
ncbi:helix-turn-helix domain-containing protein [Hazenella coriacea]|uniref:Helix-turn-helix protein n=1 Tax=Hazenella coriacea TaxID=1179467 RepID=A0A4R3L2Q0_9BACL|nr:helix-turn-helix domain-containing protein [Hazenella coriacea]TCS92581.1 helix-turn-helix protein [Hazenella coriacea]